MNHMDGRTVLATEDHAADADNAIEKWDGNLCAF